jgi:hypothetical protein
MKKIIKSQPVVFTPQSTGVSEILEELITSLKTLDNLKLEEPQYQPTPEEEVEIESWLEQDKEEKVR